MNCNGKPSTFPWHRLPRELQLNILSFLACRTNHVEPPSQEGIAKQHVGHIAKCATVCRDWQEYFENVLFRKITVHQKDLARLGEISPCRTERIRHLWLRIELLPYDCHICWHFGRQDHKKNGSIFEEALRKLFGVLHSWKARNSSHPNSGLTLELSVHSPSDSQHQFQNFSFDDDDDNGKEADDVCTIDDMDHGWLRGRRFVPPTAWAVTQVFGGVFGMLDIIPLEFHWPAPVVKHLLVRRQTRRFLELLWLHLPKHIKRLAFFEDFDEDIDAMFAGPSFVGGEFIRTPSRALGASLAALHNQQSLSRNKGRRPLSRSKSTSSVVRNPVHALESIDPAVAERDAGIAAVLSYHRAQERPSSEMIVGPRDPASFFPDSSDGATSMARQSLERSGSVTSRQGTATSVRFAGPAAARPRRNLALRASEGRDSPTKATSRINVFGNTSTRPSSTMSFHTYRPAHYSLTRRYLESLQPPDACYSPEEDVVSMPFSFRKLRKSRSMYTSSRATTTGNASSYSMPAKGRLPPTHSLYKAPNNENEPPKSDTSDATGLRASTSMSFLKNRRGMAASRSSSRAENDVVVRLAREKYREQMEDQERLQAQSSATIRSKNRRSEGSTGLRKSLRNSSNNSTVLSSAFSSNGTSVFKQQGLRKTARKVSNGLRSKLKGLFTRGKSASGSEKHEEDQGTDGNDSDGDTCLHASNDEGTEEASMSRVASRIPSLHDVPSNQQLRSTQGSVESLESDEQHACDERSRVTSWTNSVTNTVSSMGMLGEWERQRLSVIKENGMHISSSSARPIGLDEPELGSQDIWSGTEIDSERVYSALMKRLGEISPEEKGIRAKLHADNPPLISVPDRNSSTQHTGFLQRTASTIRDIGLRHCHWPDCR
ncbi:hypothetical protein CDV31_005739 [Fusarium ambrosium]|uniref:F-box domain-containing protein n=1 Tax=Fusarium ambrosium TaxID=131363 RepID=A0A428UH08_9HYPO|nr:hypothetical protein CDV31_005739 [Fusarium ambrosium]